MEFIFLLPILAAALLGLVVGYFLRPRKDGWRITSLFQALGASLALLAKLNWQTQTAIEIRFTDIHGVPIEHVRSENPYGPTAHDCGTGLLSWAF